MRAARAWGEPVFAGGYFFSVLVSGMVRGRPEWSISGGTDGRSHKVVYFGKWGMVRVGRSASRIIGDQSSTDTGGGDGRSRRGWVAWQSPVGHGSEHGWTPSVHAFPPLGSQPTEVRGQDNQQLPVRTKVVLGSSKPMVSGSPIGTRKNGRRMRPAGR